jgi:hypothetical protein
MSFRLNEATPFGAWGGLPGTGSPGLSSFLRNKGYSNEEDTITLLPKLDAADQVRFDIMLNMNGISAFPDEKNLLVNNSKEKEKLILIFQGKLRDAQSIKDAIKVVHQSKASHQNRVGNQATGSSVWNQTWMRVYDQWLAKLTKILGELNET